jgi:5-methylcytosine-specific restriction endonuclease McrA
MRDTRYDSGVSDIITRSRGGRNAWRNTVAACGPRNQRKGDRTPAKAGMVLRVKPTVLSWAALARR